MCSKSHFTVHPSSSSQYLSSLREFEAFQIVVMIFSVTNSVLPCRKQPQNFIDFPLKFASAGLGHKLQKATTHCFHSRKCGAPAPSQPIARKLGLSPFFAPTIRGRKYPSKLPKLSSTVLSLLIYLRLLFYQNISICALITTVSSPQKTDTMTFVTVKSQINCQIWSKSLPKFINVWLTSCFGTHIQ